MRRMLIFYDISDDRVRNDMVKLLKRCGFYRLQKSVFLGMTSDRGYKSIELFVKGMKGKEECRNDSVIVMYLDDRILRTMCDLMCDEEGGFREMLDFFCGKKVVKLI